MEAEKKRRRSPSPEAVARRNESIRRSHADRSPEQKDAVAEKISARTKGLKRSPEQCERIAQGQRGKTLSDAHKQAVSEGLKLAYVEGRKGLMPEFNRKGIPNSPHTRALLSAALKGRVVWNTGVATGPRSEETRRKISAATKGKPHPVSERARADWLLHLSKAGAGRVHSADTRKRMSESGRRAYAAGRTVPYNSGYGKGSFYETPFQGLKWLRSSSELQRARELDKEGLVWFHEAIAYPVQVDSSDRTYRPDFWVLPDIPRNEVPADVDASTFLQGLADTERLIVEDVKGWWGPRHKTFEKISAFQGQYPRLDFRIVVRGGLHGSRI